MREVNNIKFNEAVDPEAFNTVKMFWPRYIILFMATYPFFRAKWFLRLIKNQTTHKVYKDDKLIGEYTVKFFIQFFK